MDDHIDEATTFNPHDAPLTERLDGVESRRNYYERLASWNRLDRNGKWLDDVIARERDEQAIIDAIASQLSLTDYQTAEARRIYETLPDDFRLAYATNLLAFCACGIAGKRDGRDYHPNKIHPNSGAMPTPQDEFVWVADEIDITWRRLLSCWNRIKQVVDDG